MPSKVSQASHREKIFFMMMMFMWASQVTPYTGFNFGDNPLLMPLYLLILAYYYISYCKKTTKPLVIFVGIFAVWFVAICIKYGGIQKFSFPPLYYILIAHIAYNIYDRKEFFAMFENILVKFCVLSLFVWGLANIVGDTFVNFMHSIAVYENHPPTETYSFVTGLGSQFEMGIRRNIGFTWEPGKFSCWVLLGLFFNVIQNNFNFSFYKNKHFYILFLTLLSTLSTTGYAVFGLIILLILYNKESYGFKVLIVVGLVLLLPTIISLSFIGDKIINLVNIEQDISAIEYFNRKGMESICPQRFMGAYVSLNNLITDPLLGFNQLENSYGSTVMFPGIIIAPSEGIIGVFAKYGLLVGSFFYFYLIKSSVILRDIYQYKGKYYFLLFFLAISFSYDFWEDAIMMSIYLMAFYRRFSPEYVKY